MLWKDRVYDLSDVWLYELNFLLNLTQIITYRTCRLKINKVAIYNIMYGTFGCEILTLWQ